MLQMCQWLSIKDYTCFHSLEDMNSLIQPPEDELLVYKWEGFGRPYSITGSLSSLESFGHVDDLDLSQLQFLEDEPLNR